MKFLRKRSTIVLASIGAAGAIAALATAASFALFYDPPAPVSQTFATGTVTLGTPFSYTCNTGTNTLTTPAPSPSGSIAANTPVAPGFSTDGYPTGSAAPPVGDQSGTPCTFGITYTGSMPAFLATDVTVTSTAGSESSATCDGTCLGLYSPTSSTDENDLEVWTSYKVPSGKIYALGIGGDQTISEPGTTGVDTGFGSSCGSSTGDDCPVNKGYTVLYRVYVYWPLGSGSEDNPYQGSSATVTLNIHAVQAYDNALKSCSPDTIMDPEQNSVPWTYSSPDQPAVGWGGGFNSGTYPATNTCPITDDTADNWTAPPSTANLYPFSHKNG
ncbi:MAG: hypothetical protein WCB86_02055 [Candidatus Dormiibacterota bacterium]